MAAVPNRGLVLASLVIAMAPLLGGARECGSSGFGTMTPAPDMSGKWSVKYDDSLAVDVTIGGAHYQANLPSGGGTFTVEHGGASFDFDLDCARPEIVCPSEAWPDEVTITHRDPMYPHRIWVTLPRQTCDGRLVAPKNDECGEGTPNPDCEQVCMGELRVEEQDVFGVITDDGASFDLLLGAGVASNGFNCALLGVSLASADLETTGEPHTSEWRTTGMDNGEVKTGYSGGCLWAGDPDMDGQTQALVLGASVVFTTGFDASRE